MGRDRKTSGVVGVSLGKDALVVNGYGSEQDAADANDVITFIGEYAPEHPQIARLMKPLFDAMAQGLDVSLHHPELSSVFWRLVQLSARRDRHEIELQLASLERRLEDGLGSAAREVGGAASVALRHLRQQKFDRRMTHVVAGKFGELVQGVVSDAGTPRAAFIAATLTSGPYQTMATIVSGCPLEVVSARCGPVSRTQSFCQDVAQEFGIDIGAAGIVQLVGGPPIGKGLGSSSCDMAAAVSALSLAHPGIALPPSELYSLMCHHERSDPVNMWESLVCAYPEHGEVRVLGPQPQLLVLGWDTLPGQTIDTADVSGLDKQRQLYASEYADLIDKVATGDTSQIKEASTRSAVLNNALLPKKGFDSVLQFATRLNAGVICAHSGTYLGLLFEADANLETLKSATDAIRKHGHEPEFFSMGGV